MTTNNQNKLQNIDKAEYNSLLKNLEQRINNARQKAVLSVNKEMLLLYWDIGRLILEKQKNEGWGAKIIDRLSKDLRSGFPEMKGFSPRNLKYMRKFAETNPEFVQPLVAQLPWSHNVILMEKIKSEKERNWYAQETVKNGWSRNVLVMQIESGLYKRQGDKEKTTNFDTTLPAVQS
ncbi:MAG: DUF1016 domain-containing protein, partial [bacterium]|nr:DUF1016 domain-containing protein [bacterium]